MILIGSSAIKYHFKDFPREPKDVDLIVSDKNYKSSNGSSENKRYEYLENPILYKKYGEGFNGVIYCNDLCTLKASHLCWNINWEKHMFDLQFLLKKGCQIDVKLWRELYDYWNDYHGKNKRSDLKMTKEDFFNNAVNYDENEHDFIHTILNPIPVYTKCLKDGEEVELDENKFYDLSHSDKLEFVREEIYVMAYERYRTSGFRRAYNMMLKKFIISHAPLFSIVFILENYIELQNCTRNFIQEIENGIKQNKSIIV